MSTKTVQIAQSGAERIAEPQQVFVAEGEQIEFVNAGSAGTLLVLAPETVSILSPTPTSPVTIAGGATVTFTFLKPEGSGYLAQVLPEGAAPGPIHNPGTDGPVLTILSSTDRSAGSHTGR
jgi:hypothetical protein